LTGWHQSLELRLEAYGWLQPTHMGLGYFIPSSTWWWRCSWFSKRDAVLDVLDYACNWFFLLCSSSVCAFMLWCFVLASSFCIWCWIHNSLNIWDHQLPHTHSCPSTSSPHLVVQCQVKSRIWRGKHGMVGWECSTKWRYLCAPNIGWYQWTQIIGLRFVPFVILVNDSSV
jgi:hypothetical protein